jgi:hypothetical protein
MACNRISTLDDLYESDRIVCPEKWMHLWSAPSDVGIELSQITVLRSMRSTADVIKAVLGEKHFDEIQYPDHFRTGVPLN